MLLTLTLLFLAPTVSPLPGANPDPALAVGPPALVQDDEGDEKPDKRPEIKEMLSELSGHVKARGKEDSQAVAVIDRLIQEFAESGPKDRKAIAKGVAKCLDAKRDLDPESEDMKLALHAATAVALGRMGPESVKALIGSVDAKSLKVNLDLQKDLILSLGKTEDPKAVETLTGLLKHPKPRMQAAGAEALASFSGLDQEARKEIVYELIKIMMGQKSRIDSAPNDQEARQRWDTISGAIIGTLQELTGHEERDPDAWQRWWNKNKKEDWDGKG